MDEWGNCSLKGLTKDYVMAGASGRRAARPAAMPGHAEEATVSRLSLPLLIYTSLVTCLPRSWYIPTPKKSRFGSCSLLLAPLDLLE